MHSCSLAYFFFALAVILVIAAVILALWLASLTDQHDLDEDRDRYSRRRNTVQYASWFFFAALVFAVLSIATGLHDYGEANGMSLY